MTIVFLTVNANQSKRNLYLLIFHTRCLCSSQSLGVKISICKYNTCTNIIISLNNNKNIILWVNINKNFYFDKVPNVVSIPRIRSLVLSNNKIWGFTVWRIYRVSVSTKGIPLWNFSFYEILTKTNNENVMVIWQVYWKSPHQKLISW